MRFLALAAMLLVLVLPGCSDSSNPDQTQEPDYPDIDGLVAFYEFDGDLENQVSDLHAGSPVDGPSYTADRLGEDGRALYVTGPGHVVVPDHAELRITGGITLAAWVRPEASGRAYSAVIDKQYFDAYSFGMGGTNTEPDTVQMISYIVDDSNWTPQIVPVGTGVWSHIVFTYDETSQEVKFYLNGAEAESGTQTAEIGTSDEELRIGASWAGDYYKGGLDQVAIFNRALTPTEVQELYEFE